MIINLTNGGNTGVQEGTSQIIITAETGSTVYIENENGEIINATEINGVWTFKNVTPGIWTVYSYKGEFSAIETISISEEDQLVKYEKIVSYFKAYIAVTYPVGSTCTCTKDNITLTATNQLGSYTFEIPYIGDWTVTSALGDDSDSEVVSITEEGQTAIIELYYRFIPEFTYTGSYKVVDDSNNTITDLNTWRDNWKIRFTTGGTFTATALNSMANGIDVFCVGGGGKGFQGSYDNNKGGGGGGGYTNTKKAITVNKDQTYTISIGGSGGATSAFGCNASYGKAGTQSSGGNGGSGGGGAHYRQGGSDGGNGATYDVNYGGYGQKSIAGPNGETGSTREFGESGQTLYAGGGAGNGGVGGDGGGGSEGKSGTANTGGGGAGGTVQTAPGSGGSGIVIIRNKR